MLKARMNAGIHGKIGMLIDSSETVNEAVRECFANGFIDERNVPWPLDFRSARRRATLAPNLFAGHYEYAAPTDLATNKIIDIPAQAKNYEGDFFLVPTTEFGQRPQKGMVSVKDYNGVRILQICSDVNSKEILVSSLDSLSAGLASGSWTAFGDAESLTADQDDYIDQNGSILFDLSGAGGTTAGIVATDVNGVDMTDYMGGTSAFFVWARINSATNLTNYILRFGNDASNYYYKTVTAQADGTAFVSGWNALKFDVTSLSSVGSPSVDDIRYIALYMTKTAGKINETDYKFDSLKLKRGVVHNVEYYTKYGWQTSAGAYQENSTDDEDVVVADADEYQIVVQKSIEKAAREVREYEIADDAAKNFRNQAKAYMLRNPSEAKIMTSSYHSYA